jgi:MFS family permease
VRLLPRPTGLWLNANFVKLWSGQTVSILGTLMQALQFTAVLVLDATPFQMALLAASAVAPGLVVGLAARAWIDRLRRRPILIATDLGRAALLGSVPAAYFLDVLTIEHLYVVALLSGLLTFLFNVAYGAYLPSLVRRDELIDANSKLSTSASAVEIGAFSLGGWLVQWFTAITATVVDALTFLLSGLLIAWIRTPEPRPARAAGGRDLRREIAEGLRRVWSDPLMRAMGGYQLARAFGGGAVGALILLYGTEELGFQPGMLGTIFAVGGAASVVGAMAAGRVTRRVGIGRAITYGAFVEGVAMLLIPLARGPLVVAGALLAGHQLGDGAAIVHEINQVSLRQAITPGPLLGRVNASFRMIGLGAALLGSMAAGVVAEAVGMRVALVGAAVAAFLGAAVLALSPIRSAVTAPRPTSEGPGAPYDTRSPRRAWYNGGHRKRHIKEERSGPRNCR